MSKESKTARASMNAGASKTEKKVISDENYIKNLRYDLENGLYVAQEGARALLKQYDGLLTNVESLTNEVKQNEAAVDSLEAACAELSELIRTKFASDYTGEDNLISTAMMLLKNLAMANESIATLAREAMDENEQLTAKLAYFETPNTMDLVKAGEPCVDPLCQCGGDPVAATTEYHVTELPATLPLHCGDTLKLVPAEEEKA